MKFFFIPLLFWAFNSSAQVDLNKGLMAYYPFNGNARDESGNNNHAAEVKASFVADRFNKPSSACSFNGKNNYIRISDNESLHFRNGMSVSAWVLIKDFYEGPCHGNRIIMKGDIDYQPGNFVLTFDDNYGTKGNNCYTRMPDKQKQSFYGAHATPVTDNYVTTNKWYLLTYTYDGYIASLYVDCNLQARGTIKNFDFDNTDDLFFGRMNNGQYPYWFNGLLDEVRIYNRALNKAEITKLCNTAPLPAPDLTCSPENKVEADFNHLVSDCYNVTFKLTAKNSKKLKTISWDFGDGKKTDKPSPTHLYPGPGSYKVRVITTSQTGCRDTFTRKIQLQELQADYTFTEEGNPGEIRFKVKNNKASYRWNLGDETTLDGESSFAHRYTGSGYYTAILFAKNNAGCTDTVRKQILIRLPDTLSSVVTVAEPEPVIIQPVTPAVTLEKRNKEVAEYLAVENDSLTLYLYDNGIIDGDSITLVYNNAIILTHQHLTAKPLVIRLKLDPSLKTNELQMYAENLGSIPPNTALLIADDGKNRHSVNLSSTRKTNGTVYFSHKQERPATNGGR